MTADPRRAALLLIDIQPSMLKACMGGNQVLDRAQLLGRGAQLLAIPTLATAHVPEKLGGVSASIL
ncbi:MAG: hydrolase, partial [Armatimonadota bacterium]